MKLCPSLSVFVVAALLVQICVRLMVQESALVICLQGDPQCVRVTMLNQHFRSQKEALSSLASVHILYIAFNNDLDVDAP